MIQVLDQGYVKLIEHWGSDERIIESARMSTDKGFLGWGPYPCSACGGETLGKGTGGSKDFPCKKCEGTGYTKGDEKLLEYLWNNKHTTPFEMAGFTCEIQAPIFVFRQWHRHRTQSYNEMSGRYIQLPDMFYLPSVERLIQSSKANANKQASGTQELDEASAKSAQDYIKIVLRNQRADYETLCNTGIANELARLVLPVAQYSRMRASANLLNWLKFLTLRMDHHAQWEIQQYAYAVAQLVEEKFPRTYKLFQGE